MGNNTIVSLGTFSEVRERRWELSKWKRWVYRWEERLEEARALPLAARTAAVWAILTEVEEALTPEAVFASAVAPGARFEGPAVPVVAPLENGGNNSANPAKQGIFDGDGHILLNMVLYGGAGFIISLILKYMGRGELSMLVMMITGFVILRQVIYVLKELMQDVTTLVNF
jgi:hypothetical protein